MLKNLFGAMGVDPSAAGAMPDLAAMSGMMGGMGMPPMGGQPGAHPMGGQPGGAPPNQQDFEAQMNQFEQMFKSMGMQMDGGKEQPPQL